MMELCVARLVAWAPALTCEADWRRWATKNYAIGNEGSPACARVPAMLRRRLTRWGRLALEVTAPLTDQLAEHSPIIFSSRHGDTLRTEALLSDLAEGEPLSPTAFSLSVHNASLGLYTIVEKLTAPSIALAAGRDTLFAALIEAQTWLSQGATQVLLVHADEPLAPFFAVDADEPQVPIAIALLLTANEGERLSLSWTQTEGEVDQDALPLAFLRFWFSDQKKLTINAERLTWQLTRSQQCVG